MIEVSSDSDTPLPRKAMRIDASAATGAESKRKFFPVINVSLLLAAAVYEFLPRDIMHPR